MRTFSRGLAVLICLAVILPVWAGVPSSTPAKRAPGAAKPVVPATKKPPAPRSALRVINFDLQGPKGPLSADQYSEIKALVTYLQPDILALHNVQRSAGDAAGKPLAQIAASLTMYYAFQPLTDTLGSALLTKYPITKATYLAEQSGAAMGMQVTVGVEGQSYLVLVVRPPNPAISREATQAVASAITAEPTGRQLVLASFSPGTAIGGALKAWSKAGLADPGTGRSGLSVATYPVEKPKERLDFIMVSRDLLAGARYEVVRDRRFEKLSAHLPVQIIVPR